MKKYIALKDNLERIYLSDKVKINGYIVNKNGKQILVEHYKDFITININSDIKIFYFLNDSQCMIFSDFIEVTNNSKYLINNILNGSVKNMNVVIEGADGVGKSTLVSNLANLGYLVQDRAIKEITQKMRLEIPREIRINEVKKYLQIYKNRKVIFLYLSDEKELEKRIYSRKVISEFDKKAISFQRAYLDTYNSLKYLKNLFAVDCLQKTPEYLTIEIKKLIEES